jgi:Ca2+-binding RTX toxin-like protein
VDDADVLVEKPGEGMDGVQAWTSYTLPANLENLQLLGTARLNGTGNSADNQLDGNAADNVLIGGAGNDVISGYFGNDTMIGGTGNDIYIVSDAGDVVVENSGEGLDLVYSWLSYTLSDNVENLSLYEVGAINGTGNALANTLFGNNGANLLDGRAGNDMLQGAGGNDVLQGMDGDDALSDTAGNNLFHGGAGADSLSGSAGSELFIGGTGNDTITTGAGADIIAFNRGDGADVVNASAGADNTLSLGGGIRYADMTLAKNVNDLVLNLGGNGDRITFKDWYAAPGNRSVLNMQVIAEAMADFNAASSDRLVNRKIENFDFLGIAGAFDAAGAPASWAVTNALLSRHLGGNDTSAVGADLAYQYGKRGSLAGMGFDAVQGMLASGSFGVAAQALQAPAVLNAGPRVLS